MIEIPRAIDRVRALVPDLDAKIGQFEIDDIEIDEELMEAFFEEVELLIDALQSGMDASDDDQIRTAAHSMKGMAGTMGLPEISVLAREIEMAIRAGDREGAVKFMVELIDWGRTLIAGGK